MRAPVALALAALLPATSCSWLFVEPPPARPVQVYESCTESRLVPGFDTAFAAIGAAGAVAALALPCEGEMCELGKLLIGVPSALGSIVFGISASTGYGRTARCREAHAASIAWAREHDPASGTEEGRFCRTAQPECDGGLVCIEGRCARPRGTLGGRCKEVRPGLAVGGYCEGGFTCRDGVCVEPARPIAP